MYINEYEVNINVFKNKIRPVNRRFQCFLFKRNRNLTIFLPIFLVVYKLNIRSNNIKNNFK